MPRKTARFETKPPDGYKSGGYERWRSWEVVPGHPDNEGPKDVYEYVHRLAALAWGILDGIDDPREVHHGVPPDVLGDDPEPAGGLPFLNVEWALEAVDDVTHFERHCKP